METLIDLNDILAERLLDEIECADTKFKVKVVLDNYKHIINNLLSK